MNHKILLVLIPLILSAKQIAVAPNQFVSKALISITSGDTITLSEGVYKESIILKSGVTLIGAGASQTILKGNGRDATLTLSGSSSVVGITVSYGSNGIQTQSGRAKIIDCVITRNRGSGILAVKALPEIINTVICNNNGNGIQGTTIGGGAALFENLTIASNQGYGISVDNSEPIAISNSIFYKNGIRAINPKKGTIIATGNIFLPKQKEFEQNNRTQNIEFEKEKKKRPLYILAKDSPGQENGAKLK